MTNYRTRLTLSPVGLSFTFGKEPTYIAKLYNWSYHFSDGSRLVGRVRGKLGEDGNTLVEPTDLVAEYVGTDGQTVLLSWQDRDFATFEATLDGTNLLVVASSDRFVENSICIVSSESSPRAQVTHWRIQLLKEEFNREAWSLAPSTSLSGAVKESLVLDWVFSPLFPFWQVSFNLWLPFPKLSYHWTFNPCFPFFPSIRLKKTAASMGCCLTTELAS
ncbi:hypothetical protein Ple7327_4531 [Pleurocapsa sp. PCC 7327]|uniref:hypothetical protein n=1 Tax=Pleurocapsa sp. PCC 7327 TaxID=118163 RepID=UPI00029FEC06|nr:hypothetical protein [Pleurocapsa sp. PCC 7327]AFY79631.1 hypothetical protein Ple7327_4531 [Pleurocapsa sp. PCC 7327]